MKNIILAIVFILSSKAFAETTQDTTRTGTVFVMAFGSTKGIAPIPAFSLRDPAAMYIVNAAWKKFEIQLDGTFSLGWENRGKPWFSDIWLRYNIPLSKNRNTILTFGYDWSMFYQPFKLADRSITIHQAVRYPTYQVKFTHHAKTFNVVLDWWYTYAMEKSYGVKGSYIGLTFDRPMHIENFTVTPSVNLFGLDYNDGTKGLALAYEINLLHKSGFLVGSKLNHTVNVQGLPLAWNVSFGYSKSFKIGE